ncbi:MAG: D-aminoacyl-tRNA deacylase [Candidatus Woesearchaeota archaeon]|nr:D-aminoacyl-tRNA deacylase [Candidatus Woesearchaeota archaeon]
MGIKKRIGFVFSEKDEASINIREVMIEQHRLTESEEGLLVNNQFIDYEIIAKTFPIDSIYIEDFEELANCNYLIFPSKHKSSSGITSFSVHTPGNFSSSPILGGKASSVSCSWVEFQKLAFLNLLRNSQGTIVTPECTHHGPYTRIPCCYIEIGSSYENWINKAMAKVISDTIFQTLQQIFSSSFQYKVAVGVGGPHYCHNFQKVYKSKEYAISHICPRYNLNDFNLEIAISAMKSSSIEASILLIDWKGLGPYKDKIREISKELLKRGYEVERTSGLKLNQIIP